MKPVINTHDNMKDIYKEACQDLVNDGDHINNTRELQNYMFKLTNINNNVAYNRNLSIPYALGELVWYFAGRNDVNFISNFSSFWSKITDDGKTNNSAYGDIIYTRYGFDQVEQVVEMLKSDEFSRRAVINFNAPNPNRIKTKDEICTLALVFHKRDGKLDCTGIMRSNDIWLGTPYDIIFFTELQKLIANKLNLKYGTYTHHAVSFHVYDRNFDDVMKVAEDKYLVNDNFDIQVDKLLDNIDLLVDFVNNSNNANKEIINKFEELELINFNK